MCVYVHAWRGHHLYQPLLNIHSFSLNKQINHHYRRNTFLFLSICSVLPLPASWPGVWVAQGQEGALLPTRALQHRQHLSRGATSLGHPNEDRVGMATRNPRPPPLYTSTLFRLFLQQLATRRPWVVVPCNASQGVPHSFPRHRELPVGQQCPSRAGMTNHPGNLRIPGSAPRDVQCPPVHRSRSKTLAAPASSRATRLCFVVCVLRKSLTTLSKQSHWTKMQTTSRTGGLLKNAFHF